MKKLKISLVALVFTVGIGGAVVQKIQAAPKPLDPTYNWNGSGPLKSGQDLSKTVSQAQSDYGCTGASTACATGVPTSGSGPDAHIFQP